MKINKIITILLISLSLIFFSACNNYNLNTQNQNIINNNNDDNNNYQNIKTVSVGEFQKIYNQNIRNINYQILDVRTPQEYFQGHIPGAKNIDFYSSNFKEELNKLDKNKTYMIYCRSGHRSGETLKIMKELGFKNIINLEYGFNSWIAKGYKIEK